MLATIRTASDRQEPCFNILNARTPPTQRSIGSDNTETAHDLL